MIPGFLSVRARRFLRRTLPYSYAFIDPPQSKLLHEFAKEPSNNVPDCYCELKLSAVLMKPPLIERTELPIYYHAFSLFSSCFFGPKVGRARMRLIVQY